MSCLCAIIRASQTQCYIYKTVHVHSTCRTIRSCEMGRPYFKLIFRQYNWKLLRTNTSSISHNYVKSKMSKGIGIMYKARQFWTKKALPMLYHAYIFPYMTYCIEVWGCASQTQLNCLFLLQKKIIRIMSFSHYLAHTNLLFLPMEVLPLRKIFLYKVGLIMYK